MFTTVQFPFSCQEDGLVQLADAEDNLYLSCSGEELFSFSPHKEERWRLQGVQIDLYGIVPNNSLLLAGGGVSGKRKLFAIHSANGTLAWQRPLNASSIGAALPVAGKIWVLGIRSGTLIMWTINSTTGTLLKSTTIPITPPEILGPMGAFPPFLYFSGRNSTGASWVYAYHMDSSKVLWKVPGSWDNLAVGPSSVFLSSSTEAVLSTFTAGNGSEEWREGWSGEWFQPTQSVLAVGEGVVVLLTKPLTPGGVLVRAYSLTGTALWERQLEGCAVSSGVSLTAAGLHLVACGVVWGLHLHSGAVLWSHNITLPAAACSDWAPSSPIVLSSGVLSFVCRDRNNPFGQWHVLTVQEDFLRQLFLFLSVALMILILLVGLFSLIFIARQRGQQRYRTLR